MKFTSVMSIAAIGLALIVCVNSFLLAPTVVVRQPVIVASPVIVPRVVPVVRVLPVPVVPRPFVRLLKREAENNTIAVNASIISLDIVEPVCVIKSSLLECEGLMNRRFVCQIWPKSFSLNSTISDLVASAEIVHHVEVIRLGDRKLIEEASEANMTVPDYAASKNETHRCIPLYADKTFDHPGYLLTEGCFSEIYQIAKKVPIKFTVHFDKKQVPIM